MSGPVLFACLWALAGTVTALLPMRWQLLPGLLLLISAPVLIAWLGFVHGLWVALLAGAGFVSMFRRPLRHLCRRVLRRGGCAGPGA
ncbi:DUF2484 family protein [Mesobaculum littorinae]|uniref:DUF2484 family protein n=1 Tax=Mesobaculum littorinae TaxID=2486419 RepID=A0A438AJ34_9RHOB|nr:DUF2484 family protein [Mesobaculum littorinae]RVV98617.1 DUF2484 family protein [Mesobaculum littorinae]